MDDTFVVWPHPQPTLAPFLDHLNGIHQAIQFIMEEEVENWISFLDVMVRRSENKLTTTVFRKATHTDRHLHYQSHHHPRTLSGVVKSLKQRAVNVCEPEDQEEELKNLDRTFQMNGYLKEVIQPILRKRSPNENGEKNKKTLKNVQDQETEAKEEETEDSKVQIMCLPYVKGVSEKIKKTCKAMNATIEVKAVFKPYRTMRQMLMKVRNPVPVEKRKGVVYEILCWDCTQVYVGETGRTLKKRMSEHKQAMKRFDEKNRIAVHVFKHDHRIAWDEARIATLETSYWRRRIKEAINIRSKKGTMNLDCGLTLSNTWRSSLKLCKEHG